MRPHYLCIALVASALAGALPAHAGTVAFTTARCESEADRQTRPDMYFPPNPPACASAIWAVEDNGSGLRRITAPRPYQGHREPAWSPDGKRIAYAGEGAVWVAGGDGSNPRRITEGDAPAWSPDGLSIVVSRDTTTRDSRGETILGNRELFAVAIEGLVTRRLTDTPEDEILPRLSNDGTKVFFTRRPSYSPAVTSPQTGRVGLFSLNLIDGREERVLSTDIPLDTQFGARFSPDGKRLALSIGWSIYTLNAGGTDLRRRTEPQTAFQPAWSGLDSLVFVRPASRTSQLVRLELRTNDMRAVTPMEALGPFDPDWAPPGGVASLDPPPDAIPPAVGLFDVRSGRPAGTPKRGRSASVAAARGVRRADLGYVAADASGLRSVRVAFGRRGRRRCRFLGRRSYSKPRSCRRPVYRAIRSSRGWSDATARLRPGRYVLYMRTKDARGNRTARARRVDLKIRR